jgi:hypothetical protein
LRVVGAEHEPGKPAFALLAREIDNGLEYARQRLPHGEP